MIVYKLSEVLHGVLYPKTHDNRIEKKKVKTAWRAGKVTAVLFLDIEGAFLNANPERLVHNLRKWKIPDAYTVFIYNMC